MDARIDVITLAVADLERALAFYRDGLGLRSSGVIGTEFEGDETTPAGATAMFELRGGLILALYPRTEDQGIRAAKVAEYLGLGIPTVSYDYEVVADLRETGAGILVDSPREFVAAVERLARDDEERARLAARAREAGAARQWDVLAREMNELLDRYLSPA